MLCDQWQRAPWRRRTLGADKGYDLHDVVPMVRGLGTAPHVSQNLIRRGGSAIDGGTTRQVGYAQSQHARPRIEPAFGCLNDRGDPKSEGPRTREGRLPLRARECGQQAAPDPKTDRAASLTTVLCAAPAPRRRRCGDTDPSGRFVGTLHGAHRSAFNQAQRQPFVPGM